MESSTSNRDQFGGIAIQDRFGGVPVSESKTDQFGGVAVEKEADETVTASTPSPVEQDQMRASLAGAPRPSGMITAGMTEPPAKTDIRGVPIIESFRSEPLTPEDFGPGLLPEMAYALNQTANGFIDFFNSADGAAVVSAGPLGLGTLTAAGFAIFGAIHAPEQFNRAIELAKEGKMAESRAAFLELTVSAQMVVGGAGHVGQALTPKPKPLTPELEAQVLKGMSPAAPFEEVPKNEIRMEPLAASPELKSTATETAKAVEQLPTVTLTPEEKLTTAPMTDQALKATKPTPTPTVKESLTVELNPVEQIKQSRTPNGMSERGGDFWQSRFATASRDELIDALKYVRGPESNAWHARFMNDWIGAELRNRGELVDSIAWQLENLKSPTEPPVAETPVPAAAAVPAAPQQPSVTAKASPFFLRPRRDGVPDILDAIQELGGIRTPRENSGGEYDGYAEAVQGPAKVLRRTRGGQSVDKLMQELESTHGYRFESTDQFWDAVSKASASREALRDPTQVELADKFQSAALSNQGRSATEGGNFRLNSKDLSVGDRIKIKSEWFDVTGREGENVFFEGERSGRQTLPDNAEIHLDRGGWESKVPGMGAAARGELHVPPDIPPEGQVPDTSIKNASLDQARIDLSLEPIEKVARKGWEQVWDEAGAAMEKDPSIGQQKTDDYANNPRAFENEVDQAIVFRHEIAVRTTYTSVLMDLNEAIVKGDGVRADELRRSRDLLEQKLDVVDTVAKAGGSAAGGVLGARRMMVREDMSLGAITRREQIAADRPLTDIEHAEIAKLHAEMEAKDAAFDEALTAKEVEHADAAHKLALETLRAEAAEAKVPAISPYIIGIAERIGARLKADADVSRKALAGKFLSPTPKDLLHLANIMADNIYTMGLDFAKISAKMISELGPKVEPYLKDAFTKAQAIIEGNYAKVEPQARKAVKRTVEKTDANDAAEETASIIDAVKAKVEKRGDDVLEFIGGEARKLALKFVGEEVGKGRKPADIKGEEIDAAVHETLKEALPDITPVEARDAWTQYGKYSQLDKDAVKTRYREARTEQQKQSTLERLLGGEPGLKTGVERQPPTNLSRRRQKQINELKKQLGIVTTDPATQLRSALQARETYYTNRLADLRSEISKGERLIKTRNETPTSPALEALKAEYATVKAEHEAIFKKPGLTDAQKHALALKTAERNQSEWEIRLANAKKGNFETPPKGFVQRSAQLDAIRARTEAIREEVKLLKDADAGVQSELAARELAEVEARSAELERQINEGNISPKAKTTPKFSTPELDAARAERRELLKIKAKLQAALKSKTPSEIEAKKLAEMDERITALVDKINAGEIDVAKKSGTPISPEMAAKRAELSDLNKVLTKLRAAAKAKTPAEIDAKKIADTEAKIEEVIRQINEGDIGVKPKTPKPTTAELAAKRSELTELNKVKAQLRNAAKPRKTPDQIALQAFKTRTSKKMADQLDRMARGDFSKTPKRPPLDISKDAEAMKLAGEAAAIKTEFERRAEQHKAENFTTAEKLAANFTSAIALSRNVMTAYDISAVGRQGGFIGAGNPIRAVRNLIPMFRAMASEKTAQAIHQSILHRPNAGLYVRDKLFLAELDGKLTAGEEATIGAIKLVQKIPGLRASNRAYSTYLNLLRADSYDAMMLKNEGRTGSMSVEDGRAIANFINVATGRGDLGRFESFAQPAASVLFSPRLNVSRVQMAIGQPMFGKTARTASPALRRMIAEEYAKTAIGVSAFIGLAVLAGATIETDPRSSDFAKLKFGNTRIDVGMGMQQYAVALARVYSGETKNLKTGKLKPTTPGDVAGSLLRTKSTPALGAAMDIWEIGHDKNPPPGHGQTYLQVVVNLWLPITSRNVVDIMEEHGVAAGTAFEILDLLGVSIQHFDTSKTLPKREKSP